MDGVITAGIENLLPGTIVLPSRAFKLEFPYMESL